MSDKEAYDFVNSSDMEEAIVEKARTVLFDAWDLAIQTQDEELFQKVWAEATTLVLDDILTSLVEKGLVEVAGMTEDGDMTYSLSPAGHRYLRDKDLR